jgi:hypothetical protein
MSFRRGCGDAEDGSTKMFGRVRAPAELDKAMGTGFSSAVSVLSAVAIAAIGTSGVQLTTGRVLLATVVDARDRAIVDLDQDDFVVDEGGEPREIFSVHVADYPVILLLDNGAEARGDFEHIRGAAARFVTRIGQRAVAIGTLPDPADMLTSFDSDRATVLLHLEKLSVSPTSLLMPLQAIANAARVIRESETLFSAIVVVSAPPANAAQTMEDSVLFAPIVDSRAIVHFVTKDSSSTPSLGRQPQARYDTILRELAERTAGQYTTIYSAGSYAVALDRIADRLATEMMVEYLVPPGSNAEGVVRVGVKIPGARVRGLRVSR